jgi:hypothetical protein
MKKINLLLIFVVFNLVLSAAVNAADKNDTTGMDIQKMLQPVPQHAKFSQDGFYVWCGTLVKGKDNLYHLFYSRWPKVLGHIWSAPNYFLKTASLWFYYLLATSPERVHLIFKYH